MPRETATPAQLEQRLQAGEWLRSGQVAKLFGMSRWTILYWLKNGVPLDGERFYIRFRESPGGWRLCHPDDVQRVLTAHRREHIAHPAEPNEPLT